MQKNHRSHLPLLYGFFLLIAPIIYTGVSAMTIIGLGGDFPYSENGSISTHSWLIFFLLCFMIFDKDLDKGLVNADIPCLSVANIDPSERGSYYRKIYWLQGTFTALGIILGIIGYVLWKHYVVTSIFLGVPSKDAVIFGLALDYIGCLGAGLVALILLVPKLIRCHYFQQRAILTSEGLKSLANKEKKSLVWR